MTKHEKALEVTKNVSKVIHEKIKLEKYQKIPCKTTVNNSVEVRCYGNKDRRELVTQVLKNNFELIPLYENIGFYKIEGITVTIC